MSQLHAITGVRISLASPALIRSWSSGEVIKPDTINFATNLPEPGGLFCQRIFGSLEDGRCACTDPRHKPAMGCVCEKCGVEVSLSRVRRERMGHIELAVPIVQSWFARGTPSILAILLDLTARQLSSVLAYTGYLVTALDEEARQSALIRLAQSDEQTGELASCLASLHVGSFLPASQYWDLVLHAGACFRALIGAEAVRVLLEALDLEALAASLRARIRQSEGNHKKAIKRLHVVEAFRRSGINPTWAVMHVIPVLPPDLRPLVIVPGGRIVSSDLNTLYERVIYRNIRVRHFLALGAPTPMLHYEQRLLQDACDALFDNMHRALPAVGDNRRPLKSLTDILKGKHGRFRRHLLGKRVDYSGRSVICVGVDLQLHQCGLPKKLALELFKPFVMRKLLDRGLARSARHAKRLVERRHPVVWDQLAECLYEKVVLLNRAPTLHRLSIQAFEATLVEGDAIRLHPLVCSAFNADFDGDQMAVHLPLSDQAQAEARRLLLSTRNLRSPAAGEPSISLSQEIVLGCYYLTEEGPSAARARRAYINVNEARLAYEQGVIDLHTPITVRIPDQQVYDAPPPALPTAPTRKRIETTMGRLLLNAALPAGLRYRNYGMTKERLKQLVAESLDLLGEDRTAQLADDLKLLGYRYATKSGLSFAMSDMQEPVEKHALVAQGQAGAREIQQEFLEGTITQEERDRRTITLWSEVTEQVSQKLLELLDPWGTIATIVKSGATKAKFQQIRQLSGIRGLMANPSGRIIPIPVLGNYLVGLKTWEVFIAASGARKGFMDRSLNTAQSGYLTRKLVEVGMEVWTTCEDCGTREGWLITNRDRQETSLPDLQRRVVGRVLAEAAGDLPAGTLLDATNVEHLLATGITALRVRSPFTCQTAYGICCRCYGIDLATNILVKQGVAVGVIAGQSIGEPGTQLTMRTFHSGGIANAQGDITQGLPRVSELFEARTPKNLAHLAPYEGTVHVTRQAGTGKHLVSIVDTSGEAHIIELPANRMLAVTEGQVVEGGTLLTPGVSHPRQLLDLLGREAAARYLISELQQVYRGTGVYIHEKHLEVIVRQMLRYVQVTDPGETELLPGEVLDRFRLHATNLHTFAQGGQPATAHPLLLGLTRAALQTSSWVAAASFQETSKVLTQAAMRGQVDPLRGFKERIVLGLRIPTS